MTMAYPSNENEPPTRGREKPGNEIKRLGPSNAGGEECWCRLQTIASLRHHDEWVLCKRLPMSVFLLTHRNAIYALPREILASPYRHTLSPVRFRRDKVRMVKATPKKAPEEKWPPGRHSHNHTDTQARARHNKAPASQRQMQGRIIGIEIFLAIPLSFPWK